VTFRDALQHERDLLKNIDIQGRRALYNATSQEEIQKALPKSSDRSDFVKLDEFVYRSSARNRNKPIILQKIIQIQKDLRLVNESFIFIF